MTIHIEELKFQTIIGILDFERLQAQDVVINLQIDYDYSDVFINYADVCIFLKQTMHSQKFLLIEDALRELKLLLKKEFKQINKLQLKITKPSILPDCKVSVSEITYFNS